MAKGYTTKEKVEAYLGKDDGVSDAVLTSYIEAVEGAIDGLTDRNFIADTVASARLYDGSGDNALLIDDCVSVTKVEVGLDSYGDDFLEISATGSDRYFLRPSNYSADSVPVRSIELSARDWTGGRQNNRITAKWGVFRLCPVRRVLCRHRVRGRNPELRQLSGGRQVGKRRGVFRDLRRGLYPMGRL